MASKVLVKIPVAPFGHVNKSKANEVTPEIVTVGRPIDGVGTSKNTDPILRIAQLEQNIRFLQEQHQLMLTGLHQEIDSLRQRNRDLQFQLVFSKGAIVSPSSASPSSPEEDIKARVLSPKQVNVTPLQVELLERELGELKVSLQEVNTRNAYLTAIVDEQKKKLERTEQSNQNDPDLLNKLEDVESLVRKLRRENEDLRREMSTNVSGSSGGVNKPSGNHNRGGRHRGGTNNHYRGHRFPPLHTQSYWQQGNRGADRDGETSAPAAGLLPSLGNMNQTHHPHPHPHQHQHRRNNAGPPNNNQYHHKQQQPQPDDLDVNGGGGGGRRYRGGGGHHSRAPN